MISPRNAFDGLHREDIPGVLRASVVQLVARQVNRVDAAHKRRLRQEYIPEGSKLVRDSGRDRCRGNRSAARHVNSALWVWRAGGEMGDEQKTKHFICFFQPHVCLQVMLKIDEWEAETK